MISSKVKVPPRLKIRLSKYNFQVAAGQFVSKIGDELLKNVHEYGEGTAKGRTPFGGAPHWQGKIEIKGHYSGYLSDSHYLVHNGPFNAKILSKANFTWGVIEGKSTNSNGTFAPNLYHKRAADKLRNSDSIETAWKNAIRGSLV